jgi:hypothetical protein
LLLRNADVWVKCGNARRDPETTATPTGEHHITIPAHNPLKIGTLAAIIADIAAHHGLTRDELLKQLFH